MKKSIARDTVLLTLIQFVTQIISLVLNVFINKNLGTENLGLMSLTNAFFTFAIIISNGNIFVSASRFVSEEIGRENGNPGKIFVFSLIFCLILSTVSAAAVTALAVPVSRSVIRDKSAAGAVRLLACSLPLAAVSSCIKGYFNAYRKIMIPALSETAAFTVRSVIMALSAGILIENGTLTVYTAIALSVICSEAVGLAVLIIFITRDCPGSNGNTTVKFLEFIPGFFPVMLNSYIPCILSTANDALVPFTLKQTGCSTADALSKYGIFEAVVLPVLFFPSMFISCLSTILVPEISRERAGGNRLRNLELTESVIKSTVIYSLFIVTVLAAYGRQIGNLVCGNSYAGEMIIMLAPVVPFIYLEIILEGIIKGLGKHSFSSVNYLAEYIIRISSLLVFTPLTGAYGIAISYYLSNIICNISRIIMISRTYGISVNLFRYLIAPGFSAVVAWQASAMIRNITHFEKAGQIPEIIIFSVTELSVYLLFLTLFSSGKNRKISLRSPSCPFRT